MGEPVFDKLDAALAQAVMSVGAVKGVEIGAGFAAARMLGSEHNDPLIPGGFASNHAGGILAGISNGDEIVLRAAVKPIPSIALEQQTIDLAGPAPHPAASKAGTTSAPSPASSRSSPPWCASPWRIFSCARGPSHEP